MSPQRLWTPMSGRQLPSYIFHWLVLVGAWRAAARSCISSAFSDEEAFQPQLATSNLDLDLEVLGLRPRVPASDDHGCVMAVPVLTKLRSSHVKAKGE